MYKIIVKGEAKTSYPNLEELHGIDCQDEFSEYFDGDESYIEDVEGGYMDFRFEDGKLWTYTIYNSKRELTYAELEQLKDYTQGQWSDGIGEGFEQNPCIYLDEEYEDEYGESTDEVYISPWFFGQEISIKQEIV